MLEHKSCYTYSLKKFIKSDAYKGFAKTDDAIVFEAALNKHFEKLFSIASPNELSKELKEMFKCQLEISSKIQKSTTDEKLKELLGDYIPNLEKTLSDFKTNLPINTADKTEINLLVLKSFDIQTLKNINTLQIEYDLNMYEDYSCYIKYLIYTYDQAPDAYKAFIPTTENFMDYSNNIYMHQVRYE